MSHTSTKRKDTTFLWEKWSVSRDEEAGNDLMKIYMPIVHYQLQRIASTLPSSVNKDDLKSLGMVGLFDAIEKFDPNKEVTFEAYASIRVRGSIIDGLRKEDWLPRSVREKTKRLDATCERLEKLYGRKPTAKEVAEVLDCSEHDVHTLVMESYYGNILSLDDCNKGLDENNESFVSTIEDDCFITPEQNILQQERAAQLAKQMKKHLTENEQRVIALFYNEGFTFTEIASILDLTTSRISQIHSKAIAKLKRTLDIR
ncbi:MAG: FliA/WhiG family RNA polymerase sigma factor [Bacilli bacterium]